MKHTIKHGATVDIPSLGEIQDAISSGLKDHVPVINATPARTTIRAGEVVQLDATGSGVCNVLTIPPGFEFDLRRLSFSLSTCADSVTGAVQLGVAGVYLEYLRSGRHIEYGMPEGPTGHIQVPGIQTWSAVEGPYLSNGEILQIVAAGLTANATLEVEATGVLLKPSARFPR